MRNRYLEDDDFICDFPGQVDREPIEDDIDIDVCLGCGRYYSVTPMLIEAWHKSFNYREGAVMDQLCYGCMTGTRTPPHEY